MLLIDDERFLLARLERSFRAAGYEVLVAVGDRALSFGSPDAPADRLEP